MEPGIYDDLPAAAYHSGAGISKSGLDLIHRSPLHYACATAAANDNPTPSQALGTALHLLVLEPDLFARRYALQPKFDRRTKEGKAAAEAWAAEHPDAEPMDAETWDRVHRMRDSVMAHPAARALLTRPGKAERSVYWIDPATGELCRCRPDYWTDDDLLGDLKSCRDASPEGFARSVATYRYHVQDAFYLDGVSAATGRRPRGFVFIAVESDPPFAVATYQLRPASRELGRLEYRRDLARYAQARRSGVWQGYSQQIEPLDLPAYVFSREEAAA